MVFQFVKEDFLLDIPDPYALVQYKLPSSRNLIDFDGFINTKVNKAIVLPLQMTNTYNIWITRNLAVVLYFKFIITYAMYHLITL